MESTSLTQQKALKDLNVIKKVLNETSHQVGKLYLFFYSVAFLYLLYPIGQFLFPLFVQFFKSRAIEINGQPYLFNKESAYLVDLYNSINLISAVIPLFIAVTFFYIKFKKLHQNQRFAHRLLNIWGYGFIIIFVGTTINGYRLASTISSLPDDYLNPGIWTLSSSVYQHMPTIINCIIILFIYLIMNLITNKKLFIGLFFINLIAYAAYLFFLPLIIIDMEQLFNQPILSMFIDTFWMTFPFLLIFGNFMIIGMYFRKMYRVEQLAYEN